MKMKIIAIMGCLLMIGMLVTGCTMSNGQQPVPTTNINNLNSQIQSLQNEKSKLESQHSTDNEKIQDLTNQISKYQADIDKAKALDDTNWIYPAKVEYNDYRVGVVCTYVIRIHNGSDSMKTFKIGTEDILITDDMNMAKTPPMISDWVTYDGNSTKIITLSGKETRDVTMQFCQPLDSRFYSVTDKGINYKNVSGLNSKQLDIMSKFVKDISLTVTQIAISGWNEDIKYLSGIGLICPDNRYQFITVYGEDNPQVTIATRVAIKWTIDMSEFSK